MTATADWSVVIPLKPLAQAKSRLRGLTDHLRRRLVVAMARDVQDAVLACGRVREIVVVSPDPRWESLLRGSRTSFVADGPADSLNDALRRAATACRARRPGCAVATLTADLPALRPADLERALTGALAGSTFFVPDANGEGTTLFASRSSPFRSRYGSRSRARHTEAGATELHFPRASGIRRDVDTLADLAQAQRLGVGAHTQAWHEGLELDARPDGDDRLLAT